MALARYIAGLFSRSPSSSSPSKPEPAHLLLGRHGERLAARHLRRNGYKVLYRNFRPHGGGEIDLVCRDGKTLVFVEVKTRTADGLGRPADAVDAEKEEAIILGANAWLRLLKQPGTPVRIDIVEVIVPQKGRPQIALARDALAFTGKAW